MVVGGRGELVMQKRHPTTGMAEGEEEGDDIQAGAKDGKGALDKYSGVKVRGHDDVDKHSDSVDKYSGQVQGGEGVGV